MAKGTGTRANRASSAGVGRPPWGRHFTALDGLATFLRQEGNTLLIKGYAGAGKTTLALQLLSQLSRKESGVYVSSRVSKVKVQKELPWTEFREKGKRGADGFEDLRLGTPEFFLEKILRVMSNKGRSGPDVVVLDTWDAIAKEMTPQDRLKAEKMLIAAADGSSVRTIFVSEEPERTTMDYLVDGMVEMKRYEKFGRVFREIEVQKLRGTVIEQHKYLYTLHEGKFTLIPPYAAPAAAGPKRTDPIPISDDSFSLGSKDLDGMFQGIMRGTAFAVVYDEDVPYSALRLLSVSAMVHALNTGKGVCDMPLLGTTNSEVADVIRPFVDPRAYRECLAIASLGAESDLEPPLYSMTGAEPKQTALRVTELAEKVRERSETKSVLMVESVGTIEAHYASRMDELVEGFAARVSTVRASGTDSLMLLIQHDSPLASKLLAMCRRYARMITMDRSIVILGEKPATPSFALDHDPENPLLGKLTLIV